MEIYRYRFFFFSGKGGAGKTTFSTLLALKLSGKFKTLVISLDPAHSLSYILGKKIGEKPTKVTENLYALEVDIEGEMKNYLRKVKEEAKKVVSPLLLSEIEEQIELAYYSPGAFELAMIDVLFKVKESLSKEFKKVVFDTAPSGYTLRLVALPELLINWLDRLLSMRREALRYQRLSQLKEKKSLEEILSEDPVYRALTRRKKQYSSLRELLTGKDTLFGVVFNPQVLPIEVGKKTVEELESLGIPVKLLIANRFSDPSPLNSLFPDKAVIQVPPQEEEPVGIEKLKCLLHVIP